MNYKFLIVTSLFITSCSNIEVSNNEINKPLVVDENIKFINFLNEEWDKTLNKNPLFASYVGDKRSNNKINSNSIEQYLDEYQSNIESLKNLKEINILKLTEDNVLNYKLYEFDITREIEEANFPTYFLRINQRGGIQSFYETGNRLVRLINLSHIFKIFFPFLRPF